MELVLDDQGVAELRLVLDEALHDLTSEIADTDNASYRTTLRRRRQRIEDIRAELEGAAVAGNRERARE